MSLSSEIAELILNMLSDSGTAEIRRNDLAERLGCVPSQINYVLSSRFTPEHGYIVESRRGGGGCIKITRATYYSLDALKMHLVNSVGDEIDEKTCRAHLVNLHDRGALDGREAELMLTATAENAYRAVPPGLRARVRADIFKRMLIITMKQE